MSKGKNMICYFIIFFLLVNLALQFYSLSKKDKEGYQSSCNDSSCNSNCYINGSDYGYCENGVCQCADDSRR